MLLIIDQRDVHLAWRIVSRFDGSRFCCRLHLLLQFFLGFVPFLRSCVSFLDPGMYVIMYVCVCVCVGVMYLRRRLVLFRPYTAATTSVLPALPEVSIAQCLFNLAAPGPPTVRGCLASPYPSPKWWSPNFTGLRFPLVWLVLGDVVGLGLVFVAYIGTFRYPLAWEPRLTWYGWNVTLCCCLWLCVCV